MADSNESKAEASAEKAYAAAAEAAAVPAPAAEDQVADAPAAPEPVADDVPAPVEFPAKVKRARKPRVEAAAVAAAPKPKPKPKLRRTSPVAVAKPAVKKSAPPKLAVKRAVAKPAAPAPKIKAAPKPAAKPVAAVPPKFPFIAQLKDIPMDVSSTIKDAVSGAQAKAKEAFSKTSEAASEYTEFAKGNVEAFVESGKILAAGLQEIGNQAVAESKTAFETLVADVKTLSAVKSPVDFFKLQTELLRRNFDSAVAYGSKTSEALVKLTGDTVAPLSGRVTAAVEKVKQAA